jgi:hypothetical protein
MKLFMMGVLLRASDRLEDERRDAERTQRVSTARGQVLPTVQEVTGRPPHSFERWAEENAGAFR